MSKMIVYIASTVDGYIARKDGSLDRLDSIAKTDNLDYGYADFISTIDTIIMGKKTYNQILGFDCEWPYSNQCTYVLTHDPDLDLNTTNTHMLTGLPPEKISKIRDKAQKDIWILGGGEIVSQCLDLEIVDEMILTIVPIVLGTGISLFSNNTKESNFSLQNSESFPNGLIKLHYKKTK